ncbi:MAG: RDD family protein [Acidimicrobiales bacterium]
MTDPPASPVDATGDPVASVAQRCFGRAIDLLVVATFSMGLLIPTVQTEGDTLSLPGWTQWVALGLWVAYEASMTALLGTTVGKMAVGIQVVDRRTGRRPSWPNAIARTLPVPLLLPLVSFFALAVYPTALFDLDRRRGITDRIADTVVVRADPARRR